VHLREERIVKRLAAAVLVLAACHSGVSSQQSPLGAATPQEVSVSLLHAIEVKDLNGILTFMGTEKGSLKDVSKDSKSDLEKRGIILTCYFAHDKYRLLGEDQGTGGRRIVKVELTRGELTRQTSFTTVQGPNARWFVETMDIQSVKDLCQSPAANP
jgi:hypothetical protein